MDQLRWILAGLGVVIIILIYLWGMRTRIREELRRRRRAQQAHNEPFLELSEETEPPADAGGYGFGKFSSITPDHPLADKVLVDVEITPVRRPSSQTIQDAITGDQSADRGLIEGAEESSVLATREFTAPEPEPSELNNADSSTAKSILEDVPPDDFEAEPPLVAPDAADTGETQVLDNPFNAPRQEPDLQEPLQMTLLLTVLAGREGAFSGSEILATAQDMGLRFHKSGVLDCLSEQAPGNKPVFSIAHLREPGVFDLNTIETLNTPGLLVFMHLPGPLEPSEALNFLLSHSQQLADELGGSVCDEHHNRLTTQHMGHLQSKIGEFERQLRLHKPRY
ncbi:MAG: hypothetical protein HC808_12310 [Candidatus Competibacteraceae bacterium]|nr:hypothetical protein [Candidatus Competibacteraceae bacterium]